jgi:acetoin utilization deacetylase AcuC-like enzyme
VDDVVVPLGLAFKPQLILISAGYDAHVDDPLANCSVTDDGYAAMTRSVRSLALSVGAPIGCTLEGGYALGALARSVAATMEEMGREPPAADSASGSVAPLALDARRRLSQWWPELG